MDLGHSSHSSTLLLAINAATTGPSTYIPELHPFAESHDNRSTQPQLKDMLSTTSLLSIALPSHSSALTQELESVSQYTSKYQLETHS